MKQILITGCGRSGTKYIARVLERVDLEVRHERKGRDGCSAWHIASPLAPLARPNINEDILSGNPLRLREINEKAIILHQVREPIAVISSTRIFHDSSWEFIYKNILQIKRSMTLTHRCMAYWFYWNLLAESQAEWTYQVERLFEPVIFNEFCKRIGTYPTLGQFENMKKVSTRKNSRDKRKAREGIDIPFTHEELEKEDSTLYNRIVKQGERYGYEFINNNGSLEQSRDCTAANITL